MAIPLLGAVMGAMGAGAGAAASGAGSMAVGMAGRAAGAVMSSTKQKAMQDGIIKGPKSMRATAQKSLQKMTGIQVSTGAIAKQSQLLSGVMGAMFQIFGGFVDIVLMPFMPIFVKLLVWMASGIPKLAGLIDRITGYFKDVWAKSNGIMEFLGRLWGDLLKQLYKFVLGLLWEIVKFAISPTRWFKLLLDVTNWLAETSGKIIRGILMFIWGMLSEMFGGWIKPILPVIDWITGKIEEGWNWLTQFTWISTIMDHLKTVLSFALENIPGGRFVKGLLGGNPFKNDKAQEIEIKITAGQGIDIDEQSAYGGTVRAQTQQEDRIFDTGASLGGRS